jgi:hypothetical protein
MKTFWEVLVKLHNSSPPQQMKVCCQLHTQPALFMGEAPPKCHCTQGWVGPITGLHDVE